MKKKNQYYVVWAGKEPGVFNSWEECRKRVEGFAGAKYKGFSSCEEAVRALNDNPWNYLGKSNSESTPSLQAIKKGYPSGTYLCVDAACSGNPGVLEYRGVLMPAQAEVFRRGPFPEGTTNIGEFLAIVTGLAWLQQQKLEIPLYSDSRNGLLWVKNGRVNTKLERTRKNEELFSILDKALDWIHSNRWTVPLLKWETSQWGEIPADFGRK